MCLYFSFVKSHDDMIAVYCSVRCWCGFLWSFKIEQPGRRSPLDLDLSSLHAGLLCLTWKGRSLDGTVSHSVEILLRFTRLERIIAHLHGVVAFLGLVVYSHSRSFTFEEIPEQCSNCKVVEST
jgi:hypothetical protein